MSNAIGYIRVSTQGQAEDGISLTMQRQTIEAYCSLHDSDFSGLPLRPRQLGASATPRMKVLEMT
jgi:hypothetical protein